MKTDVILDETLRYIGESSRKFYRVVVTEEVTGLGGVTKWVVTRKWGRIGSLGQSKTEYCFTRASALNKARDILNGKQARGYRVYKTITSPEVPKPDRKHATPVEESRPRCEALDMNDVQCAGYIIIEGANTGRCDNCGQKLPGAPPDYETPATPATFADEFQQFAKGD